MIRKHSLIGISITALMLMSSMALADEGGAEASSGMSATQKIGRVNGQNTSMMTVTNTASRPVASNEGRTHDVVEGDTLWGLSETYMQDPFKWPALWSYNPQITNPHWIYPGDTICLEPCSEKGAELTTMPEGASYESPAFKPTKVLGNGTIIVPGFYVSELPENRGHILYSDQEKHLLAPNDEVQVDWVDEEMRKKVSVGQRFTVFEQGRPVLNEDGDEMAVKLIRLGSIEMIDVQEKTLSTAKIIQATREIERGNLIIPNDDLIFTVKQVSNTKSQEGRIIDTIDLQSQLASDQYVIINRGSEDGVNVGNRWVIFEQREGLDFLPQGEDTRTQYATERDKKTEDDDDRDPRDGHIQRPEEHSWVLGHPPYTPTWPQRQSLEEYEDREYTTNDLPLRKIGEVLVIDTKDKFCTGIIRGASREIGIDTRVVMINGY